MIVSLRILTLLIAMIFALRWCIAAPQAAPGPSLSPSIRKIFDQANALFGRTNDHRAVADFLAAESQKAHERGDRVGEAVLLGNIVRSRLYAGQVDEAEARMPDALRRLEQEGFPDRIATVFMTYGQTLAGRNRPEDAYRAFREAARVYHQMGNKGSEGWALGISSDVAPQTEKESVLLESIHLAHQAGDRQTEAVGWQGLAFLCEGRGDMAGALDSYQRMLALVPTNPVPLNNIGEIYRGMRDLPQAVYFYKRAIGLYRGARSLDADGMYNFAVTLNNLGGVLAELRQGEEAEKCLHEAVAVAIKRKTRDFLPNIEASRAVLAFYVQKDYLTAEKHLRTALAQTNSEASRLILQNGIAEVLRALGKSAEARRLLEQVVTVAQDRGLPAPEAIAHDVLGEIARQQGHLDEARQQFQKAVALLEQLRDRAGAVDSFRSAILESGQETYQRYIGVLCQLNRPQEAFGALQLTKARRLRDIMGNPKIPFAGKIADADRNREASLRLRCDELNQQWLTAMVQRQPEGPVKEQLAAAERELSAFTDELYAKYPELSVKRGATYITPAEIASRLPPNSLLVEFALLDQLGDWALALSPDGKITLHRLKLDAGQLTPFSGACAKGATDWAMQARALERSLFSPLSTRLVGVHRLILCPDGALWSTPFAALLDSAKRPLVERYSVSMAYSGTAFALPFRAQGIQSMVAEPVLVVANPDFDHSGKRFGFALAKRSRPLVDPDRRQRRRRTPARVLAATDRSSSDRGPLSATDRSLASFLRGGRVAALPGAEQEGMAVSTLFPDSLPLTGWTAQEVQVKRRAPRSHYLHFATHGYVNDTSPLLSGLLLAEPARDDSNDGILTAREIFDLDLANTEMAVLSACDTGRGSQHPGEGLIGLTWALTAAGCPTSIVSQWSVNDASTAFLMERFYTQIKAGKGKAEALRAAALAVRAQPRWANPRFWAPFVLVGKP